MNKRKAPEGANKKTHTNNNTKDRLLSMLQSAGRPLLREELSQRLGISDRQVRRYKAQLLSEGHPIASTSHEAGYSYGDKDLYMQSARECYSRAIREINNGQLLEMAAKALSENDLGQITLEEVMQL